MPNLAARFAVLGIIVSLLTIGTSLEAQPVANRVTPTDPVDLVLVVDVSYSMFRSLPPKNATNDPGGIRWDAIQFLIDTAGPEDRVALVLYRADAALVTRYLDPYDRLAFSGGGTGSLLALQAVWDPSWNLNFPKQGRQPWVMLFTDGMDERSDAIKGVDRTNDNKTANKIVWRDKAFDYLNEVDKEYYVDEAKVPKAPSEKATADLLAEVAKTVTPYRKAGVPVFTFGLSNPKTTSDYAKSAMRLTLAGISDGTIRDTQDPRFGRLNLFNEASNNVELFKQLQELTWKLREQWLLNRTARGRSLSLTTPDRQLCNNLGVLLYRKVDGAFAQAPDNTIAEVPPLKSRSHHYVAVPVVGTGGSSIEATYPADSDAVAILGMRLKAPILEQAKPEKRVYTPIDAIPIQITFDPRESKLSREMFRVVATLRPPGAGKEQSLTIPLQSTDWDKVQSGWAFEGNWVPEEHSRLVGDKVNGVMGDWWLDVTVSIDAKHSPLHGATRSLLPTKVTVGEYPVVTGPTAPSVISNVGERAGRGEVKFTVTPAPIPRSERGHTTLEAELVPAQPDSPAWKGNKSLALGRIPIQNGVAVVALDLSKSTDFDWSAVSKEGTTATVIVRSPWAKETAVKGSLTIQKEAYELKLGSDELVFDLSGNTATDSLPVMLDTRLYASERVMLSTQKNKSSDKLEVSDGKKKVLLVLAKGTDPAAISGGKNVEISVQLARTKDQMIDPGEYTGKLHVLPVDERAASPVEVNVRVLVNQPELRLRNPRNPKDPPKPVSHLRLAMLAGSKEVLPLEIGILGPAGKQAILSVESQKPTAFRLRGSDSSVRFPFPGDWFRRELTPGRFMLAVAVPQSVHEGRYLTEVALDVKAEARAGGKDEVAFSVRRPVEIEVHRFAVTADTDTPLSSPGSTEDRRLLPDRNKFPAADAGLELALGTPFTDKDLVVRWWAKLIEFEPTPAGSKADPVDRWFDGRISVRELSAAGPGQSVLGPDARTLPVSKLSEQRLVVTAQKLDELPPRVYRCKIRFYGTVDGKPLPDNPDIEPPHFDLPISVLVRGRVVTADRAVGENKLLVAVTCFGCPPGTGQLRTPDLNIPPRDLPSEIASVPDGKTFHLKPVDVAPGPGLTRYNVYWPKKWDVLTPPGGAEPPAEDTLPPVRFWQRPQLRVDRRLAAAGDKITVRLPITPGTFETLNRPVVARVTRNGTIVEEFTFTEDRAERVLVGSFVMPSGTPLPPAGDYNIELAKELVTADKAPTGTDVKDLKPEPVTVQLGLEVRKEERLVGPIIYGGGFFSADVVSDPAILHITNHTLRDMRYLVQIRYPSARTVDPQELVAAKGEFVPTVHLEFKPTVTEGTLKPGETVDLGVEVGLSSDALDAYLNDRTHPTFGTKNGALMVVTLKGPGPDGQEFEWELRQPLVVETQSWRNRGMLLGLVGGAGVLLVVIYGYRRWRIWAKKQAALMPLNESPQPAKAPPLPEDDSPLSGGIFGGPPQ
ncbi:MAG: hypothetical protein K8U57_20190 [Planctomycetes bacterium]|nr:hypothetical protein [Planctomycetota bacterium]